MSTEPKSRRARQAEQTREEILRSARRLFAEQGYARTTVRQIADGAGVSAQTVYDSVGSKQTLVARLNDLIDDEAQMGRIVGEAMASGDPSQIVAIPARISRSVVENCGDIVRTLVGGAAAEVELAAVLEEGRRRHVGGSRRMVDAIGAAGALADGIEPGEAAELLAASSDTAYVLVLRDAYGWSFDRIEAFMTDTARRLLLADT